MRAVALVLSLTALAAVIVPPALFFADAMALDAVKSWMLAATVVWFATAPVWME